MPLNSKHLSRMHILRRLWRMSLPKANRGDSGRSPSSQSQVNIIRNCHQWFGVALNMKNMFGAVPGAKYGRPKNILHWKGVRQNILNLYAAVQVQFIIADGIVAMKGNGPLNGTARHLGNIVLVDDAVTANAAGA